MYLDDKELLLFQKLGFEVKDGELIINDDKISFEDLDYAGFNIYISKDNKVFEKCGEELIEITSEELEAERRFISRNLK